MLKIFKYPIPIEDFFNIQLPEGAKILHIDAQQDNAFLWALVDPGEAFKSRHFRLAGTGHPIDATNTEYIGTFQMMEGTLVWHVFELI